MDKTDPSNELPHVEEHHKSPVCVLIEILFKKLSICDLRAVIQHFQLVQNA